MISVLKLLIIIVTAEKILVSANKEIPIGTPITKISFQLSHCNFGHSRKIVKCSKGTRLAIIQTVIKKISQYVMAVATPAPTPPSSGAPNFPKMKI